MVETCSGRGRALGWRYASLSARVIGIRAARRAGSNPPTKPINAAKAIPVPRMVGVS